MVTVVSVFVVILFKAFAGVGVDGLIDALVVAFEVFKIDIGSTSLFIFEAIGGMHAGLVESLGALMNAGSFFTELSEAFVKVVVGASDDALMFHGGIDIVGVSFTTTGDLAV